MKLTDINLQEDDNFITPEEIQEEKEKEEAKRIAQELFKINHTPKKAYKFPNRNDPCPCGSGKKYKNCCMEIEQKIVEQYDNRRKI